MMAQGKFHNGLIVRYPDAIHAHRLIRHAGIARQGIKPVGFCGLGKFPDQRMLPSATADYQYIHVVYLLFCQLLF